MLDSKAIITLKIFMSSGPKSPIAGVEVRVGGRVGVQVFVGVGEDVPVSRGDGVVVGGGFGCPVLMQGDHQPIGVPQKSILPSGLLHIPEGSR